MYHYVRPKSKEYPFFNNLDLDVFRRQLDYFDNEYGFILKKDYINAIKNKQNIDGVVLTFDDGLKDHFKYVLPELEKRNLWGIFYISTGVYSKEELLGVHRVHYLKGKVGSKKILSDLESIVDESMLDNSTIKEFDKDIYRSSSYESSEKELRRLLNYYINYKYRDAVLDKLMKVYFDEQSLFYDVYLKQEEIKKLSDAGNIIGSHTVSHKVLSRLSYADQEYEINESFKFIEKITKQSYKSFCYPYGYTSSYNQDTLDILRHAKVDDACIFDNKVQGESVNKLELSRIDCNNFIEV
jgi:peptidoglycan/xylan/chitin deacetylase (PgdA/CDA1 family)